RTRQARSPRMHEREKLQYVEKRLRRTRAKALRHEHGVAGENVPAGDQIARFGGRECARVARWLRQHGPTAVERKSRQIQLGKTQNKPSRESNARELWPVQCQAARSG